jgi:hypothetical protein
MSRTMTQPSVGNRAHWSDEQYAKPFVVVAEDRRRCFACNELFTRQESFHHSQLPCYPPAATAN